MNKNILSPKGSIDQSFFIIYYILLTVLYITCGLLLIIYVYKNNLPSLYYMWPLLIIKILIAFNYKKRVLDICKNLPVAVILGFILTFDIEALAACQLIKDIQVSMLTFFALGIFFIFIQPAIIALIPGEIDKNRIDKE